MGRGRCCSRSGIQAVAVPGGSCWCACLPILAWEPRMQTSAHSTPHPPTGRPTPATAASIPHAASRSCPPLCAAPQRACVRPGSVHGLQRRIGGDRHKARGVYHSVGGVDAPHTRPGLFRPAGGSVGCGMGAWGRGEQVCDCTLPLQASSRPAPSRAQAHVCSTSNRKKSRGTY